MAISYFDASGNVIASSGTIPQYGYTVREPDGPALSGAEGTGLVYYRARYYDPELGVFTQRDPIGLRGGLNRYAYVKNNPVNFADPSGEHLANIHIEMGFKGAQKSGASIVGSVFRAIASTLVDFRADSTSADASKASIHFMIGQNANADFVNPNIALQLTATNFVDAINRGDFSQAAHTVQDFTAGAHEFQVWAGGLPSGLHIEQDKNPTEQQMIYGIDNTAQVYAYEQMDMQSRAANDSFLFRTSNGGAFYIPLDKTQDWAYISGDGNMFYTGSQNSNVSTGEFSSGEPIPLNYGGEL